MINSSIDKSLVITAVMAELQLRYQVAQDAVQSALDAATNEQTIPEHKYDTLALEASYLAHGQAKRVQECEQDIKQFKNLVSFMLVIFLNHSTNNTKFKVALVGFELMGSVRPHADPLIHSATASV